MGNWIKIKSEKDLPPEGKYVLARHNRGTWCDDTDQENVNCVVVRLTKGISLKERREMKGSKRSMVYKLGDEYGNNTAPYHWKAFGVYSFFGQEITHWMPIEPLKDMKGGGGCQRNLMKRR